MLYRFIRQVRLLATCWTHTETLTNFVHEATTSSAKLTQPLGCRCILVFIRFKFHFILNSNVHRRSWSCVVANILRFGFSCLFFGSSTDSLKSRADTRPTWLHHVATPKLTKKCTQHHKIFIYILPAFNVASKFYKIFFAICIKITNQKHTHKRDANIVTRQHILDNIWSHSPWHLTVFIRYLYTRLYHDPKNTLIIIWALDIRTDQMCVFNAILLCYSKITTMYSLCLSVCLCVYYIHCVHYSTIWAFSSNLFFHI